MPDTVQEWRDVAQERGADAAALKEKQRHLAAVYMLGYLIECNLKAYITLQGSTPTTRGSAGHDLRGLWEAAGFKLTDVKGAKRWFVETWSTALRYEEGLPPDTDFGELFEAGLHLVGYIQSKMRWARKGGHN